MLHDVSFKNLNSLEKNFNPNFIILQVVPCKPDSKPDWLLNDPDLNGKMPCLRQGDLKMIESGAIVDYLEKTYPDPSLTTEGMAEAVQIQSTFFPALAKLVKSTR